MEYGSVLITGATSGVGQALALEYAKNGVVLFINGRDEKRLEQVVKACEEKGAKTFGKILDVTDNKAMKEWIEKSNQIKGLDLVIANAGVSRGSIGGEESFEQTKMIYDININGVLNTIFPAIEVMKTSKKGQIAIMSSVSAYRGLPSAPAYSSSKACVKALGEALRVQLASKNIKINVICPAFIKSRITDANTCPMPFLMEAEKASRIIKSGLDKNKACISFPAIMTFAMWLFGSLPKFVSDPIMSLLPEKSKN